MRFRVLAADYDGTLAQHGRISASTVTALRRLKDSGRKLILVTGRQLGEIIEIFPELDLFNRVVAENGALLYRPSNQESRPLAEPPPPAFAERLRRTIPDVAVGKVIVATWQPHEMTVIELIKEMGLELQVIFNKGAVMILPSGVNKASGLGEALAELGVSPRNAVAVGDAENDHALLSLCECSVAVANALPSVKERADLVTRADHGAGVEELIGRLLEDDLRSLQSLRRHDIPLAVGEPGAPMQVAVSPFQPPILLAGSSGGGKSTLATAFIESLTERGYQSCIIDPEGDMHDLPATVTLGDAERPPAVAEVLDLLQQSKQNVTVSLVGVPLADRAAAFESLLPRLLELRARTGRPHMIVVDEIHHVAPAHRHPSGLSLPPDPHGFLFLTVHPSHVVPGMLAPVTTCITFGKVAHEAICELAAIRGETPPPPPTALPEPGHALAWFRGVPPFIFRCRKPTAERRRHVRKYAAGELDPDRSFYFRGPEQKLNLRAHNLELFVQMADGVDEDTWQHHLQQGDYSRWFREAIKDPELAGEAASIEADPALSVPESRARIRRAIEKRYTAAA